MKKSLKIILFLLPISLLSYGFYLKSSDLGEEVLLKAILENLERHHYQPQEVNDALSEKAFDNYIKALDNNKRFLLQQDVDGLTRFKTSVDDQSKTGSYEFFDFSIGVIEGRIKTVSSMYKEILSEPFDFTEEETVNLGSKIDYSSNDEELKERWRKILKYNVMTRLATKIDVQEKASEKGDSSFIMIPLDSLERAARKDILKNHNDWFNRLERMSRKDRLAQYVNAITKVFDPHTNYFPPAEKENFDIRMSGRLEGIGAQLQEKDGYIKVVKIIPGSPSAMQGDLEANDLILKVAQGEEDAIDIVDAKINDAVKLIRGKKGTEVRLTVQKVDGSKVVIPIIRDVVALEETFAKSLLMHDEDQRKLGYLHLPSFYTDFTGNKGRTSWKDVERELKKLEKDGAEALVFDLRYNGGGSLNDVVQMAGLFIEKGPIVQIKSNNKSPEVLRDYNPKVVWDKPVVIMVNEFSASASEILAAALQDYERAVIIGSHTTHGKGTVQRFIPLNQTLRNKSVPNLGSLKLTTQKFYRVNGGATQLKGVKPHIILPDNYMYIKTGEQEQKFALSWDQIQEAEYSKSDKKWLKKLETVKKKSSSRVKSDDLFTKIDANARRWKDQRNKDLYTLNMEKYRAEEKGKKEYSKSFNKLFKPYEELVFNNLTEDSEVLEADSSKMKLRKAWVKKLKKDPYVLEALQVGEDLVSYTK